MFGVRVGAARFTETKMIARQHGARVSRVFGACVGTPGRVALFGLHPANQIPHRAANGMRARNGIERSQMQTADAGLPRFRLCLYLNQFIVTRQTKGPGRDRVLGRCGDGGSTLVRSGSSGTTRVTAQEAATQRNQLSEARLWFHGQPWAEVGAKLLGNLLTRFHPGQDGTETNVRVLRVIGHSTANGPQIKRVVGLERIPST
jgi:hypothetical protein